MNKEELQMEKIKKMLEDHAYIKRHHFSDSKEWQEDNDK